MTMDYFPQRAVESRCLSVEAARQIRRHAIKKNGDRNDEGVDNLLPIPERTKEVFPTPESVLRLLRCSCRGLCERFSNFQTPNEDEELARETCRRKIRLQTFAVLCLSGCLFAYRVFNQHAYAFDNLEMFVRAVRTEQRGQLQQLLVAPILRSQDGQDPDALQRLANRFYESVSRKVWLIRIPEFVTGGQPQHFRDNRWNYPFLNSELIIPATASREFRRFVIHEKYFNSTELKNRRVFCKTISFHPEDAVLRDDANREAEILSWMSSLRHPNITELLFLFTETSDILHRFNLVFRYHRHTLADVFRDTCSQELMNRFRPIQTTLGPPPTAFQHGLWKGMLGIIDAVKAIHEFSSRDGPYEYEEMVEGGHFDIKPDNILISDDGGPPRLLLTDFGQAHLQRRYLNAAARRNMGMATLEYAPPECGLGAFSQSRIRASYDIWSLGCVLLETLVYISKDLDGHGEPNTCVHQFHRDRLDNSSGETIVTSAFWKEDRLRSVVRRRIKGLKEKSDDRLTEVIVHVESMLSIKVKDRPNIATCLRVLNSDRDLFMRPTHEDLSRALRIMNIAYRTPSMPHPTPCSVFLWRETIEREVNLTMIIETPSSQRWVDRDILSRDALIIETYYGSTLHYGSSSGSNGQQLPKIICRFRRLHRGTTFHFDAWKDFTTFFHLVTHQNLAFGKPPERAPLAPQSPVSPLATSAAAPRWGFRFSSIRFGNGVVHERGMCQIWSTDTAGEYADLFLRNRIAGGSVLSGGGVRRTSTTNGDVRPHLDATRSRFKLAVFAAREAPGGVVHGEVPSCYAVELDLDNIMQDSDREPLAFAFKANQKVLGSFPVWMPTLRNKDSDFDGGIPLDPDGLNLAIRTSKERLKSLRIVFMSVEECQAFKAAMAYYRL